MYIAIAIFIYINALVVWKHYINLLLSWYMDIINLRNNVYKGYLIQILCI